jgi:hypothetical protein
MRRTLIGLAVAGAILVAGCGGDDDDDGGGGNGSTASGDSATESFCEDFRNYDQQFNDDPEASEEEVVAAIRSLEPPEEIKDDFDTLLEGLDQLQSVDTDDPEAAAALQEEMAQYTEASTNIQTFVDENCGDTSVDNATDDDTDATVEGGSSDETTETTAAG